MVISANGAWNNTSEIARIAMIYEGTNGIQALDLVGRKLALERWPRVSWLTSKRSERHSIEQLDKEIDESISSLVWPLPLGDLNDATEWLREHGTNRIRITPAVAQCLICVCSRWYRWDICGLESPSPVSEKLATDGKFEAMTSIATIN